MVALAAGTAELLQVVVQLDHQCAKRLQGLVIAPPVGRFVLRGLCFVSVAHLNSPLRLA